MTAASDTSAAAIKAADAVGALIENWGFKRNMGRLWTMLYLEDHPLPAADLTERLGLSTGSVSMLLTEMQEWGVVKKTWVVGERREHFEAETSIWKLVSRVLRERELQWIRTAHEQFQAAADELRPATRSAAKRHALIEQRIAGLVQLAQVGAALLESILQEKTVDALPIKTVGELAKVVRGKGDPET